MAMLIAWQTLNHAHSPRDAGFTNRFLVVTPGITIRALVDRAGAKRLGGTAYGFLNARCLAPMSSSSLLTLSTRSKLIGGTWPLAVRCWSR